MTDTSSGRERPAGGPTTSARPRQAGAAPAPKAAPSASTTQPIPTTASTTARSRTTPAPKGAPASAPATPLTKAPAPPAPTPAPVANDDTAVRPALKDRITSKISNAAAEHGAAANPETARTGPQQPRRARLRISRVDPWSVMKTAFLLSIAFAIVTIVAVLIVWGTLGAAGVWDSINTSVRSVLGGEDAKNFDVTDYVGMSRVLGFTMLVAVIDVILLTALATLGAFLYNMSAALLGGLEVTMSEDAR